MKTPTYHDHAYHVIKTRIREVVELLRELRAMGEITSEKVIEEALVLCNLEMDLNDWFREDKSVDGLARVCKFHSEFILECDEARVLWDHIKFYWH
jgi:hypothetical protein